ncbi:hypothetical protein ACFLVQ_01655 [Chloroflexota bacterium]
MMDKQLLWRLAKSDYLKLVPILALAFYLTFIPHMNYPYPVHIDEWRHLVNFNAITKAGSTTFVEPLMGQGIRTITTNLETGYHVFWSVFHSITGIPWLVIFRYFPGVIFIITVLSVYIMASREGFGWEAALCTCLITTTVGILGPGFLVPVAMGLLFLALSLFLVFNFKTWWSYLVLFLFICFLLSMHATTAVGLIIILIPYILLNLRGNFKHSLGITLALATPFLILFPWIFSIVLNEAEGLLTQYTHSQYVDIPHVIRAYGYLPIALCLLGTASLVMRGGKKSYGMVLGLLSILIVLVVYFTFHYGIQPLYTRSLMYMMLMVSIVAGAGLMWVRKLSLPEKLGAWIKAPFITRNMGNFLCIVLVVVILAITIPDRLDTPYYYMIDNEDYEAFVWIKNNIDESYDRAILDPWKATPFATITGKYVYTRIHVAPVAKDEEAYAFIRNGSSNTTFLRDNGISMLYTRIHDGSKNNNYSVNNTDLVKLADNIYILKELK